MRRRQVALLLLIVALVSVLSAAATHAWLSRASLQHLKVYRLLDVMQAFQTYANKLYFAGMAQNKDLAGWYAWKLESALRDLQQRRTEPYAYKGWDAAELSHLIDPALADLTAAIKARQWDRFPERYGALMARCNACHIATEHHFVVVRPPLGERAPAIQKFD